MTLYDDDPPPASRLQPGTKVVLGIIGACAACLIVVGMVALARRGPVAAPQAQAQKADPKRAGNRPAAPVPTPASPATKGDPWPECGTIRKWLRDNSGEPGSLEIIEWQERKTDRHGPPKYDKNRVFQGYDDSGEIDDYVNIGVKYRLRNVLGGMNVERRHFIFKNGSFFNTFDMENRPKPGAVLGR